jgi:hypothetical protein
MLDCRFLHDVFVGAGIAFLVVLALIYAMIQTGKRD